MSTPHAQMSSEFWSEFDKQEYWVKKWAGTQGKSLRQQVVNALRTESKLITKLEYNKQKGNRWINYIYANPIVGGRTAFEYHSVCYWEGYGSFGTFSAYRQNGESVILLSTTHYWQRLCERNGDTMSGVHTAMKFFSTYPSSKAEILPPEEGDTRRRICIHYTCGAAYGVEISEEYKIFELRTFIDKKSMTGGKAKRHSDAVSNMDTDTASRGMGQIESIMAQNPNMELKDALRYIGREYFDETYDCVSKHSEEMICNRMKELRKTLTHEKAVEQCLKEYPLFDRSTERVDDGMAHFYMASIDDTYIEEQSNKALAAFISEVENGEALPKENKELVTDIFGTGFKFGANVMTGYIAMVYDDSMKYSNIPTLQEYAHSEFLEGKKWLDKRFKGCQKEVMYMQQYTNARAFDDGMKCVGAMASKYLGIVIESSKKNK